MEYITGVHAISEHLKRKESGKRLFVAGSGRKNIELIEEAKALDVTVTFTEMNELSKLVPDVKHRGLVLQIDSRKSDRTHSTLESFLQDHEREDSLILVLDSVQDPHNFGAIIRSADQFLVDCIVIPERRSVKDTPTVSRVSSGADAFTTLFIVKNVNRALDLLKQKGYWIYGADVEGETINRVSFSSKTVLVMGREGGGIRRLVKEHCDQLVSIPSQGHVDSFNVSVAAGILMYEIRRKQKFFS